jgi:ABC-type polysaccharide/polyol phosphate export permease
MTAPPERPERPASLRSWWEVVRELAVCDFRLKYHNSALGYAWSMLSPLLMLSIYYFVFRHVVGIKSPGYLVYLVVGIVYWMFFQDCTFSGMNALEGKASVLKSIRVSPALVVLAGAASTLITLGINSAVLAAALAVSGRLSRLAPLAILPVLCLVLLATGLAALVALLSVRFRDMGLVWNLALQALFWLTPVVYTVSSESLAELLYLNPLARCLYLIRWFLVYDYLPRARFVVLTVLSCLAACVLGVGLLVRRQHLIPESL